MHEYKSVEGLVKRIMESPAALRYHRRTINNILGRPADARLGDVLLHAYRQSSTNLYEEIPLLEERSANFFCKIEHIQESFTIEKMPPNYLTEDMPQAIAKIANKRRTQPVIGYRSEKGSFVTSFFQKIPVTFSIEERQQIIPEISSRNYDAIYAFGGVIKSKSPKFSCEAIVFVHDEFLGDNYCHWILDWMPRVKLLLEMGVNLSEANIFLPRAPNNVQRKTLSILGFKDKNHIVAKNLRKFSESSISHKYFVGSSSSGVSFSHALHGGSKWALDFIQKTLGQSILDSPKKFLLIQRRKNRKLLLDRRSQDLITKVGFFEVHLEDYEFEDQVALFSGATHVIGVHGAGLANLVFCRPGTKVLEIFPTNYSTAAYWMVACVADLQYSCAVGISSGRPPPGHIRDYDIHCPTHAIDAWLSSDIQKI